MRFERLVIETGSSTFSLALHPRLTIIAGLGAAERAGLREELVGALGASRTGVHLELMTDQGRRLAVFRPEGARHRVVDIDQAIDLTDQYCDPNGAIDLLGHEGIESGATRRAMFVDEGDMAGGTPAGELIGRLAAMDQTDLWSTASRVRVTDEQLLTEVHMVSSNADDAEVVDRVEMSHHSLERAADTHARVRRIAVLVAAIAGVLILPVAASGPSNAVPLLGVVAIMGALALLYQHRVTRAERSEQEALDAIGAPTYMALQVQRVTGLVTSQQSHRRLQLTAEDHREAAARWVEIAGDVSVDWALEHHEQITAAARLNNDLRTLGAMSETAPELDGATASAVAQALLGRMTAARRLGRSGEGFPIILNEPFAGLDTNLKPPLLELLSRTAGSPQAILLTEDEDVVSWGRLEALAGELSILEPTPNKPTEAARQPTQHSVA